MRLARLYVQGRLQADAQIQAGLSEPTLAEGRFLNDKDYCIIVITFITQRYDDG